MNRARQICTALICVIPVIGTADLPTDGGYQCPASAATPPSCSTLGGNGGSGIPSFQSALGQHHTPARSVRAAGSAQYGSRSITTGLSTVPPLTLGIFGDINMTTFQPVIRRTDGDNSCNGIFGLSVERTYFNPDYGTEGSDYSDNTSGYTLIGPRWLLNYDIYLDRYDSQPALRTSEGSLIGFTPNGTNTWNANPQLMAAYLTFIPNQAPDDENYTLTIANGDAVYGFDNYGFLLYMKDRNGNELALTYNTDPNFPERKKLDRVTPSAPDDRYLQFTYAETDDQDSRTSHVEQIILKSSLDTDWDGGYVQYDYYPDTSPYSGQLHYVSDSTGRILEEYDLTSSDRLRIKRPDGAGQMQISERFVSDYDIATNVAIFKRDGAGTPLIWGNDDSFTEYYWRDQAGLEISKPWENTGHIYAPSYVYYRDARDPNNRITFKQMIQSMKDLGGTGQSMMPEQQCFSSGDGNSSVCTNYDYPTWNPSTPHAADDFSFSKLQKIEKAGELDTHLFYDSVTDRLSGTWTSEDKHTSYTYDSVGNVTSVNINGDSVTTYDLDSYGRVTTKTTTLGTTTYHHDNRGNIRQITDVDGRDTFYDYNFYNLLTAMGSQGTTTTYEYDNWDRLTTTTNALGNKTVYEYNYIDQVTKVTDSMYNATTYEYSPTTGTLTSVTDAEGGVIHYEYDVLGRMVKLTDQRGKETTYAYDHLSRLISETNPLNQTTSYTYDDQASGCSSCGGGAGSGQVASITDPAGRTTYYDYDVADRLTTVTYSGSSDKVVHTYDEYGRRVATFDNRLPTADFPTQTFTWEYDSHDRMIEEAYPDGEVVSWAYDVNGRRTQLTDPDSNHTNYIYDWGGNENHDLIQNPVCGDVHIYYTASTGRLAIKQVYDTSPSVQYKHQDDYYYDTLGRLDSIWSTAGTQSASAMIQINSYNAASMKTQKVFANWYSSYMVDYTRNFVYDDVYRLKSEENVVGGVASWKNEYTYDLAGNRIWIGRKEWGDYVYYNNYAYNNFNQITDYEIEMEEGGGAQLVYYDLNGNMSGRGDYDVPSNKSWGHNRENRLMGYSTRQDPDEDPFTVQVSYVYDFSGRLLLRTDASGNKRKYYYDGINNLLIREKPSGGTCWRTKTVYALENASIGQVLATRDYSYTGTSCTPSGQVDTWFKYDELGNVVGTVNESGALTKVEMEAFGNVESGGMDGPRLTTKEYDPVSGLYYFGARWYDAANGRWMETDPLKSDDFNYYGFNANNPISYFDPDGKQLVVGAAVGWTLFDYICAGTVGAGAGYLAADAYNKSCDKCTDKTAAPAIPKAPPVEPCPPCQPPAGSRRYRYDQVPPSPGHGNLQVSHYHLYIMHQDPIGCKCRWQETSVTPSQPPNANPF